MIRSVAGLLVCLAVNAGADTWDLYYLGGQSNMEGYGYANELDAELTAVSDQVWIFTGQPALDGDLRGGTDAEHSRAAATAYAANLKRLMDLMRAALRVDDLPVVIGKITDSGMADDGKVMDYIDIVQDAQAQFVATDSCASYVTVTDDLPHSDDAWHYRTDGYVAMRRAFADAMLKLEQNCRAIR